MMRNIQSYSKFITQSLSQLKTPPSAHFELMDLFYRHIEAGQDVQHIIESIRQALINYESLKPATVNQLLIIFITNGGHEKMESEWLGKLGCWLIDHGISIDLLLDDLSVIQIVLQEISEKTDKVMRTLLQQQKVVSTYYQLFYQIREEGFRTLPFGHQALLNRAFSQWKGLTHCFAFTFQDIEQELKSNVKLDLHLLKIFHYQLTHKLRKLYFAKDDTRKRLQNAFFKSSLATKQQYAWL